MAVFPQLLTGAVAQYSVEKELLGPAVLGRAADASTYVAADLGARRVRWGLEFRGLSESEFGALQGLHRDCEGRLKTFTFLDPAANLLGWSEDLAAAAWQKNAGLAVTSGVVGPGGDGFTLANTGSGWAEIWQTLAAPVSFGYAFSVWVRGTGSIRLRPFSGATTESLQFVLGSSWKRVELGGALAGSGMGVSFALGVPAAGSVEVAGPQVEAQLVAGLYKPSLGRGGVYANARFADDALASTVEALDWVDARVRVEARYED